MTKTHFFDRSALDRWGYRAACSWLASHVSCTRVWSDVTCRRCLSYQSRYENLDAVLRG